MIRHYLPAIVLLASAAFVAIGYAWTLGFLTTLGVALVVGVRADVKRVRRGRLFR